MGAGLGVAPREPAYETGGGTARFLPWKKVGRDRWARRQDFRARRVVRGGPSGPALPNCRHAAVPGRSAPEDFSGVRPR
jgi:hypothetical protein